MMKWEYKALCVCLRVSVCSALSQILCDNLAISSLTRISTLLCP